MNQRGTYKKTPVDREKTCPFLLRLFWKENGFHPVELFSEPEKEPASDELQIYTWKDATLRDLIDLVKSVVPAASNKDAKFRFSFVIQDLNGNLKREEVGTLYAYKKSRDDYLTLQELRFVTGDFVDLNIQTP